MTTPVTPQPQTFTPYHGGYCQFATLDLANAYRAARTALLGVPGNPEQAFFTPIQLSDGSYVVPCGHPDVNAVPWSDAWTIATPAAS